MTAPIASPSNRLIAAWACALVVIAGAAPYLASLDAPFVFDGVEFVEQNYRLRRAWPPGEALAATPRPLAAWTFALNHTLHGSDVRGYHVVNLVVHLAAALVLLGLIRRVLELPLLEARWSRWAWPLGALVATLWAVHPLGTSCVTYLYQRYESLMALGYLVSLYALIRGAGQQPPNRSWLMVSVVAAWASAACKEVAVTIPLAALTLDAVLICGSWGGALRQRWGYYLALCASWVLLATLVLTWAGEYQSAGLLDVPEVSAVEYLRTQPEVLLHYARLAVWPDVLCLDYAWPVETSPAWIVGSGLVVGTVLLAGLWGVARLRPWGVPIVLGFLALAPSSSVVPIRDLAFEHRMYLPLAAMVAATVLVAWWLVAQLVRRFPAQRGAVLSAAAVVAAGCVVALGVRTWLRNDDYRDPVRLWTKNLAVRPENDRARYQLAFLLTDQGRYDEALHWVREAVARRPHDPAALNVEGAILLRQGRHDEAMAALRQALADNPDYVEARVNLSTALVEAGRAAEAVAEAEQAARTRPTTAARRAQIAALLMAGRAEEALAACDTLLSELPRDPEAYVLRGRGLAALGREADAAAAFARALEIDPLRAEAQNRWGVLLAARGDLDAATHRFRAALAARPSYVEARLNLGDVFAVGGRWDEAIEQYEVALALAPDAPLVRERLREAQRRRQP